METSEENLYVYHGAQMVKHVPVVSVLAAFPCTKPSSALIPLAFPWGFLPGFPLESSPVRARC